MVAYFDIPPKHRARNLRFNLFGVPLQLENFLYENLFIPQPQIIRNKGSDTQKSDQSLPESKTVKLETTPSTQETTTEKSSETKNDKNQEKERSMEKEEVERRVQEYEDDQN